MVAPALDEIAARHADRAVRSVFVYTREAHPGENYRHHRSMDDKRHHARALRDQCDLRRPILLDDLDGTMHRAYGTLPNMSWIVARGGLVTYKAEWTNPPDIEAALDVLHARSDRGIDEPRVAFYSERLSWRLRDDDAFREGLERAGPQAVSDFFRDS